MPADRGYRALAYLVLILVAAEFAVRRRAAELSRYDTTAAEAYVVKPRLYAERPAPDLCFLGTSHVDFGIKSTLFRGLTVEGVRVRSVFNYGLGGDLPGTLTNALEPMYERGRWPKVVVWDVSRSLTRDYDGGKQLAVAPLVWREASFDMLWAFVLRRAERALERASALYKERRALEYFAYDLAARLLPGRVRADDQLRRYWSLLAVRSIDPDGDCLAAITGCSPTGLAAEQFLAQNRNRPRAEPASPRAARSIALAVDLLRENGVKVVLAHIPTSAPEFEPTSEAETRFAAELAASRGIPFVELTRAECGLSAGDFGDVQHLNVAGGEKLSRCLIRRLRAERPADGSRGRS